MAALHQKLQYCINAAELFVGLGFGLEVDKFRARYVPCILRDIKT